MFQMPRFVPHGDSNQPLSAVSMSFVVLTQPKGLPQNIAVHFSRSQPSGGCLLKRTIFLAGALTLRVKPARKARPLAGL